MESPGHHVTIRILTQQVWDGASEADDADTAGLQTTRENQESPASWLDGICLEQSMVGPVS